MALRKRTVTGSVVGGDGSPVQNAEVKFKPTRPLAYTSTHIVVDAAFTVQTDEQGYFEIDIWCDEDSLVQVDYNVYYPTAKGGQANNDHVASFSLQYGDGSPVALPALINASIPAPTPDELLYTLILQLIAENGGGSPSGGAGGVLSGEYPNPGFANDMVEQGELTSALGALVGAAPSNMNTLAKISASLNNNPNFANVFFNAITSKLDVTSNLADLENAETALANLGIKMDAAAGGKRYLYVAD